MINKNAPHKVRRDKAKDREQRRQIIDPGVLLDRRHDAERHADAKGHQDRQRPQVQRHGPGAPDQAGNRLVRVLEGHAKVQPHHPAQPDQVLLPDRLVQPVAHLERLQLLVGHELLPIRPRPARHAVHEPEGDHREHQQDKE
jgi:hypothetical protein